VDKKFALQNELVELKKADLPIITLLDSTRTACFYAYKGTFKAKDSWGVEH
jgi:hypothetical protein